MESALLICRYIPTNLSIVYVCKDGAHNLHSENLPKILTDFNLSQD